MKTIRDEIEIANEKDTNLLFVKRNNLFSNVYKLEPTNMKIICVGIWPIKQAKIIFLKFTLAAPQAEHFIKPGI